MVWVEALFTLLLSESVQITELFRLHNLETQDHKPDSCVEERSHQRHLSTAWLVWTKFYHEKFCELWRGPLAKREFQCYRGQCAKLLKLYWILFSFLTKVWHRKLWSFLCSLRKLSWGLQPRFLASRHALSLSLDKACECMAQIFSRLDIWSELFDLIFVVFTHSDCWPQIKPGVWNDRLSLNTV